MESAPSAGCSHQPYAFRKSIRPSLLTSPTPMPWFAHGPLSLMACLIHMPVGFAGSGLA